MLLDQQRSLVDQKAVLEFIHEADDVTEWMDTQMVVAASEVGVGLCPYLSVSVSISFPVYLYLSVSLFLYFCLTFNLSVSLSLSLSLSLCLSYLLIVGVFHEITCYYEQLLQTDFHFANYKHISRNNTFLLQRTI